jgi:hypothetical protein
MTHHANAWEAIAAEVVKGRPGTVGEAHDINVAADLFNAVAPFLDEDGERESREAMTADPRVTPSLRLAQELDGILGTPVAASAHEKESCS